LQFNANNLKLFISSRPAPFLESKFSLPERLEFASDTLDIEIYVKSRIDKSPKLGSWIKNDKNLQSTILKKIQEKPVTM
jgi:hypothetical protein